VRDNAGRMLIALGKEKGLVWDKNAKQFAAAVKVAA
jgi:hypothetical protein